MTSRAQSLKGGGLQVQTLTTATEFVALEHEWNALAEIAATPSVFLAHDWFRAAWAWRCRDSELCILAVRRASALVGVLPMIRGLEAKRTLALLTVPDTQVCDVLVVPEMADEVCAALTRALAKRRDWDVLQLEYLAADGILATKLAPMLAKHRLRPTTTNAAGNPFVATTGTWSEYYGGRSRSLKKANNLAANRLASAGTMRVEHLAPGQHDEAALARILADVIDISRRSWKQTTGNSLDHEGPGDFIRALSAAAYARGWLSLWLAFLDDRPVAMEYQLVYRGNVHALRADFDAACTEISPGSYLFRHLLERLFGMGYARYFMGPGNNAYKARWTDRGQPMCKVQACNRTLRGHLFYRWECHVKPQLRVVRDRLMDLRNSRATVSNNA
jgi:CelD/BcsL family acetyltransferase involved in cellulose biosynthesis